MVLRSSATRTPTHLVPKLCEMIGGCSSLFLRELNNLIISIPTKKCQSFFQEVCSNIVTCLTTFSHRVNGHYGHNGHGGSPAIEMQFFLQLLSGLLQSKVKNVGADHVGRKIVEHCPKLIDQYGFLNSVLIIAVKDNDLERSSKEKLIAKLLEWGASRYLHEPDAHGHSAAYYSEEESIRTLLLGDGLHHVWKYTIWTNSKFIHLYKSVLTWLVHPFVHYFPILITSSCIVSYNPKSSKHLSIYNESERLHDKKKRNNPLWNQ